MKTNILLVYYLPHFVLESEMFQTKVVEKIKTNILCSVTLFRKSCRLWDDVGGKNIVEPGRPQVTKWRMRIACWMPKAINTHSEYLILTVFFFHCNVSCSNAPHCYVIRTLPALLKLPPSPAYNLILRLLVKGFVYLFGIWNV